MMSLRFKWLFLVLVIVGCGGGAVAPEETAERFVRAKLTGAFGKAVALVCEDERPMAETWTRTLGTAEAMVIEGYGGLESVEVRGGYVDDVEGRARIEMALHLGDGAIDDVAVDLRRAGGGWCVKPGWADHLRGVGR